MQDGIQTKIEAALLTPDETAAFLNMKKTTFYGLLSTGRIGPEPIRFSKRKVLWSREELQEWVGARCPIRDRWREMKRRAV